MVARRVLEVREVMSDFHILESWPDKVGMQDSKKTHTWTPADLSGRLDEVRAIFSPLRNFL